MSPLSFLLALGVLVWIWVAALRARETALAACRRACREVDVELLDHTVALARLAPGRAASGRLHLRRTYAFEFTTDDELRHRGRIRMLGNRILSVQMDHPGGTTLVRHPDDA
ncbi:MAG TPA: DUF3301 domain-containing protein [Gammaproteobacteria bacterium]|nr:DUF3301 domain-containing protein [Gammaproteobacteria bacterium]